MIALLEGSVTQVIPLTFTINNEVLKINLQGPDSSRYLMEVRHKVRSWLLAYEDLNVVSLEDFMIVVTELLTNGFVHGDPSKGISMKIARRNGTIRISCLNVISREELLFPSTRPVGTFDYAHDAGLGADDTRKSCYAGLGFVNVFSGGKYSYRRICSLYGITAVFAPTT